MGVNGISQIGTQPLFGDKKVSTVKTSQKAPIDIVGANKGTNTTTRAQLDELTNVSRADITRAEALNDAKEVNGILQSLGCNFKVSAGQVLSVQKALCENVIPGINGAKDVATTVRAEQSIADFENYLNLA